MISSLELIFASLRYAEELEDVSELAVRDQFISHPPFDYVDGKYIEPTEEPSYQVFVKRAIIAEPHGKVTVRDAFHRYYQFCRENQMKPLTKQDFKSLVAEVIRKEFNLGLRHDVTAENGKQRHGWCGIGYRSEFIECFGRN